MSTTIDIFDIASSMQNLLNDNTLTLKFKVFTFVKNLDQVFEKNEDNINETFIPCIVSQTNGQYRPIPGLLVSDQDFLLQVYFPILQKEDVLKCLDELASKIVGQVVTITSLNDDSTNQYPMTMDVPNLANIQTQHIKQLSDYEPRMMINTSQIYGVFQARIYFIKSEDIVFGNSFVFQIKIGSEFVRVYTSNVTIGNPKTMRNEQIFNANTSKGVSQTNAVILSLTAYYRPELSTILQDIRTGANQNKVYQIKTSFGTGTDLTQDIILINPVVSVIPGTPLTISTDIGLAMTSVVGS